ncbi:MAG: glycosyltransferase [Acidimicrobiaceae bacterium]|nr:glycosyltransferase [Acidimicrobiaceae bacterium]
MQGQVVGLAAALTRSGHDVLVVAPLDPPRSRSRVATRSAGSAGTPGRDRPPGLSEEVGFVAAGRSLRIPVNGSQAPIALGPRSTWRAVRTLRSWRPDVIHVHEPFVPGVAWTALLTRIAPVVGTFHRSGSGALYRATRPLARIGWSRLDDAVAVSAAARATLTEVVGDRAARCELVPNGVDLDRFERAEPWPSDRPTLAFLGRHESRKGLAVLLEAFTGIGRDIGLWVIGTGPETASLRSRFGADERIEWCGSLGDDDVARRLAGAEIYVAPSIGGESFGVVLLEAMAASTAVVASDIEGYRLAAGDAAQLVTPGDPSALSAALSLLLDDPERRSSLVTAGRVRARELSVGLMAARYLARYERLISA